MMKLTLRIAISCDLDGCDEWRDKVIECSNADDADKHFPALCIEFSQASYEQGWSISSVDKTYCPEHAHLARALR